MGIVNLPDNHSMIDRPVSGNKDWHGQHPKLSCRPIAKDMEHSRPIPTNSCSLAVVGDPKVGKTSLINRVISGKYLDQCGQSSAVDNADESSETFNQDWIEIDWPGFVFCSRYTDSLLPLICFKEVEGKKRFVLNGNVKFVDICGVIDVPRDEGSARKNPCQGPPPSDLLCFRSFLKGLKPNGIGSIGRKEPLRWNFNVAGKSVDYSIWDFSGTTHADLTVIDPHSKNGTDFTRVFQQLDVVLLCYDIADPDTLFSALNCWVPKIKTLTLSKEKMANDVPIILVGCQSDARQERDSPGSTIPHPNVAASRRPLSFNRDHPPPVSANQALKLSQQSGCSLYVETSAKECSRSAISAFEVAALVTLGQLQQHMPLLQSSPAPPIPPKAVKISPPVPPKPRRAVSHMALNKENIYTPEPLKQKSVSKANIFPSSPKLSLKTSKNRSSASLLSLSSQRTPKIPRKSGKHERMITIKCQRLNSAKEYEEVEVEVPEPVYETLRYQNDPNGARQEIALNKAKKNTFTAKIRNMFLKT
eukprot:TCALIF_08402-PA protein Name:"Similar to RND3 Rho-related GTP-binding protein RhoE (Pongo abelii)" AED:0.23 eAED:0.23 QI:644/0.16/0.42/0.42/1/1/7/0/530